MLSCVLGKLVQCSWGNLARKMSETSRKSKSVSRNNSIIVPPDKVQEIRENLEECEEYEDEGFDDEDTTIDVRVRFQVRIYGFMDFWNEFFKQ